jgi:1-deoxy-D-xylulose-5-phosphate reductoisomerase
MQKVSILGATGSIGKNTIDVLNRHPDLFSVFALTANTNIELLLQQAQLCSPEYVVVADAKQFKDIKKLFLDHHLTCEVLAGHEALTQVATAPEVDIVMAAIVGAAGLLPTLAAVKAGKKVLLANKEALVMSGDLFIQAANQYHAHVLPIDSEHNAIFQCLPADFKYGDLCSSGISKILLTGSGGPFLTTPLEKLHHVTPDQACAHPNWDMGRKISVDSATMMNKGLEFIEARWLFGLEASDIQVVLHPQSIIHSMVQYIDGSVLAQMGNPLEFNQLATFTFTEPQVDRYPNLTLAMQASTAGQYATTTLNAANEVAVDAFLQGKIGFMQISQVNEECLQQTSSHNLDTIEAVLESDNFARRLSMGIIDKLSQPTTQRLEF